MSSVRFDEQYLLLSPLLRIRDAHAVSRILGLKGTGSRIRIRNKKLEYFQAKKLLLGSRKYDPGCLRGSGFFSVPDPDTGSKTVQW
jgi:hypothetical protein